jgi:hypothetical protein
MIWQIANGSITTKMANIIFTFWTKQRRNLHRARLRQGKRSARQIMSKWIARTDHPIKMSQEKALKEIRKNDCLIPGESAGSAGASIIIERPSG